MMRVVGLAAVGFCVTLSGCSSLFGMCDSHYPSATWREPGIHAALAPLSHLEEAEPGLPFAHPAATGGTLSAVLWSVPDSLPGEVDRVILEPPGLVTVSADNYTPLDQVRAAVTPFLANVTGAPADQLEAWANDALSNVHQSSEGSYCGPGHQYPSCLDYIGLSYEIQLPGPFRLEALYNETRPMAEGDTQSYTGFAWQGNGSWSFRFHYATSTTELPNGVNVETDTRDMIQVRIPGEPATKDAAMARIREGFLALGITVQGPRPEEFQLAQC